MSDGQVLPRPCSVFRVIPAVEHIFNIGIVGDQRRRLQIADLIGLLRGRHDCQ